MGRLIQGILALALAGLGVELVLQEHYEAWVQILPLTIIALSLAALVWQLTVGGRASVRALRAAMLLLVAAGVAGIVLHYRGNMEFQLEMDPSMHGLALVMEILHATAPPALAPGQMAVLGLFGLASVAHGENRMRR